MHECQKLQKIWFQNIEITSWKKSAFFRHFWLLNVAKKCIFHNRVPQFGKHSFEKNRFKVSSFKLWPTAAIARPNCGCHNIQSWVIIFWEYTFKTWPNRLMKKKKIDFLKMLDRAPPLSKMEIPSKTNIKPEYGWLYRMICKNVKKPFQTIFLQRKNVKMLFSAVHQNYCFNSPHRQPLKITTEKALLIFMIKFK